MATLLPGNILYSGPISHCQTQNYKSLGEFSLEKFKSFGDRIILVNALTQTEYTARFIYEKIIRMAYVLQHLGIKAGDVVCISCENCLEFLIILFASFVVNAAVAPINITYTEREVNHAMNLSKCKIIFASKLTVNRMAKVAENLKFVKKIVVVGGTNDNKDFDCFDELMLDGKIPSGPDFPFESVNKAESVCLILCSSGTTGLPKGVLLTQRNVLRSLDITALPNVFSTAQIKLIIVPPWFHAAGCMNIIIRLILGSIIYFLPKFEEKLFLSTIEKYRIRRLNLAPPLMVLLAKSPIVDNYDLSSIEVIYSGTAPLRKETIDQVQKRIGVSAIFQHYGMTESSMPLLSQNDVTCKPGSVGIPFSDTYAKVINPDTGKALGPNEHGEICFKSGTVMKGYIDNDKETQNTIRDGWLHTGDIGYFDDDFEFFIVDRLKELIKYKGYQVPPAEMESLLLTHPKIIDAAVIGKPDEVAGELPMAFVVKRDNENLTEDEVVKFVNEQSSPTRKLRGGVIFVNEIPKNGTGKILRRVLRETISKQLISQ